MDTGRITRLLKEADEGRTGALDDVMDLVYRDLEKVARAHLNRHYGPGHPGVTLEPAALVNEAFLRLLRQRNRFANRGQFYAIATKLMLRVLLDHQRGRGTGKRGGGQIRVTIGGLDRVAGEPEPVADVSSLVAALDDLERLDPRKAEVVKLRALWGFTLPEIAETLDSSLSTVQRDWKFAKRWLTAELKQERGSSP